MVSDVHRRSLLVGAVAAFTISGGCLGNELSQKEVSLPEATRLTLTKSELELLREAGLPPNEIETETDVIRAATIVAWSQQTETIAETNLTPVESFADRASDTERTLREVENNLEDVDELITKMKNTQYRGISAWDVAAGLSPSVGRLDDVVTTSLREVRYWLSLFADVTETLDRSLDQLQASEQQPDDLPTLADDIDAAIENLDELESRASELREQFSSLAEATETVATNANEFRNLSNEVDTVFSSASDVFAAAASEIQAFNNDLRDARETLSEIDSEADERREEIHNEILGRFNPG